MNHKPRVLFFSIADSTRGSDCGFNSHTKENLLDGFLESMRLRRTLEYCFSTPVLGDDGPACNSLRNCTHLETVFRWIENLKSRLAPVRQL